MAKEKTRKVQTNPHGVEAPVRPRTLSNTGGRVATVNRDGQIKRLTTKHKTAFKKLAKR